MFGQSGINNEINLLVRYYFDGKEDYRLAAKRSPDPQVKEALDHLCQQRQRMHQEIQEIETQLDVEMSDNGHVGADLKRDWERLRGSVLGHGLESALHLAKLSDTHALEQANRLTRADLPEPLAQTIQKHIGELNEALTQVEMWEKQEHQATAE